MVPRPRTRNRSLLRLALYALVVATLIIAFLYAYELTGGLIEDALGAIGDLLGQF